MPMPYYTKVLLPDEQIRAHGRLHWSIFIRAWVCFVVAVVAGVEALHAGSDPGADQPSPIPIPAVLGAFAVIFLVLWLFLLLGAWARRASTEIVVTDRRVIFKEGFLRRRTLEMNMSKVETVDVVQSIWGRLFNYGTVIIRGSGSTYEPLDLIADPLALRTAIVAQ
jgi:uncharacterized membrane protein YdbT with pleckstrin-like domain